MTTLSETTKIPRLLRIGAFILIAIALSGYAYFKTSNLIAGPKIVVSSPQNGATLTTAFVEITGRAEHITHITLNDRQIFINQDGAFSERLLLSNGYNILTFEARDRFGRFVRETIELVYN